ncbi:MAG TPA: hypothetical protein PKC24_11665, partial [Cyclobacteriaceae bacterium]|nr:hypothetical protein [Cyclobacteriaceae bacterium]
GSGFTYLTDNYNATESEVALDLQSHYKFNDDYRLSIDADYFVISRKDELVEAKPRHLFILKPSFKFTLLEKFRISAGFNLAMDNDTLGIEKTARIYPDVNVRYDLSPSVEVFAGITGNMERVSLQTLTNQNLWIDANVPIYHSNKLLEFFGGINGRLGRRAGYELGVSASNYRNLYFFLNQDATPVKFDVVYDDGSAGVFKLHAAFNFTHSDRFNVSTRAAYTSYILDAIETPWHRPGFEFNTRMRYNIYDKVVLKAETFVMSGLRSLDYSTNEAITLSPAVDVNAGLDYLVSKKFNVFVQGTNLLNRTYPLFYQYPVRGMQIMAGFGYSF